MVNYVGAQCPVPGPIPATRPAETGHGGGIGSGGVDGGDSVGVLAAGHIGDGGETAAAAARESAALTRPVLTPATAAAAVVAPQAVEPTVALAVSHADVGVNAANAANPDAAGTVAAIGTPSNVQGGVDDSPAVVSDMAL